MYQVGNSQANGSKNIERTSRGLQTDRRAKTICPPPLFSKVGEGGLKVNSLKLIYWMQSTPGNRWCHCTSIPHGICCWCVVTSSSLSSIERELHHGLYCWLKNTMIFKQWRGGTFTWLPTNYSRFLVAWSDKLHSEVSYFGIAQVKFIELSPTGV